MDKIPKRFLPAHLSPVRERALKALGPVCSATPPANAHEPRSLSLASRTSAGRELPQYYLIYFLLIDFLEFPSLGIDEKTAWTVPVMVHNRLYAIEHRKMGLGIFAPCLDENATQSGKPTADQEADARLIRTHIDRAVKAAEPYFNWRAKQAVYGQALNVVNRSPQLFRRYQFFRNQSSIESAVPETQWYAHAAIDAFFSWTEHIFVHLAILQAKAVTGTTVSNLARANWPAKYKNAIGPDDNASKLHYDRLIEIRRQIRNFSAHGAFGKQGEAFQFHSGAGAVPVMLTRDVQCEYALTSAKTFDDHAVLVELDDFIKHLWDGPLAPAKLWLDSGLSTILSLAADGTYSNAMETQGDMQELVDYWEFEQDRAANMDW